MKQGFVACIGLIFLILGSGARGFQEPVSLRLAVPPTWDGFLPLLTDSKGWYREAHLEIQIATLDPLQIVAALARGTADVGMLDDCAAIGAVRNQANLLFWYGLARSEDELVVFGRPAAGLTPLKSHESDRVSAARLALAELVGKRVVQDGSAVVDREVWIIAHHIGSRFGDHDRTLRLEHAAALKALDLPSTDAYVGRITDAALAARAGFVPIVSESDADLAPVTGLVVRRAFAETHESELLSMLRQWFRTVTLVRFQQHDSRDFIASKLTSATGHAPVADVFAHGLADRQ